MKKCTEDTKLLGQIVITVVSVARVHNRPAGSRIGTVMSDVLMTIGPKNVFLTDIMCATRGLVIIGMSERIRKLPLLATETVVKSSQQMLLPGHVEVGPKSHPHVLLAKCFSPRKLNERQATKLKILTMED